MSHNYVKQARFEADHVRLQQHAWPLIVSQVKSEAGGGAGLTKLKKLDDGKYHIVGCSSPGGHLRGIGTVC
jgi:hypothetical protein